MVDDGKPVALITGASSGLGRDFALRLLAEGYTVYAAARRVDRMADLERAGAVALAMDVTDDAAMVAGVERILAGRGRIDVLINNAGYGQYGALEDVPIDLGRRQMEVNLFGIARLTQLCLPAMRARRYGKIFNISSIAGRFAAPMGGWYHASKFALEGYSDSLRVEVRPFGIDVVVIEPGGIVSEWAGIAGEEAERISGKGAYAAWAHRMRDMLGSGKSGSPPKVITDLIVAAIKAKRPRARYHAGKGASAMLFMRRRLSDAMFDRLMHAGFDRKPKKG